MFTLLKRLYNRVLLSPQLFVNNLSYYFSENLTNYSSFKDYLINLRDNHLKNRCFLIGNGPSVRLSDLELLHDEITFCCNRFHLCYGDTSFRPKYIVSADDYMIKDFGLEISKSAIQNNQFSFFGMTKDPRPYLYNDDSAIWIRLNRDRPFRPSSNISKSIGNGGATLLFAAQIAMHMGIKEMYLYGVDHNFQNYQISSTSKLNSAKGDGNHFIRDYRAGKSWVPPTTTFSEASYRALGDHLSSEGGFLKNASRESALPHIERIDFDSIKFG
jgi:hypothetical protein